MRHAIGDCEICGELIWPDEDDYEWYGPNDSWLRHRRCVPSQAPSSPTNSPTDEEDLSDDPGRPAAIHNACSRVTQGLCNGRVAWVAGFGGGAAPTPTK
jgi:hypothetical protein